MLEASIVRGAHRSYVEAAEDALLGEHDQHGAEAQKLPMTFNAIHGQGKKLTTRGLPLAKIPAYRKTCQREYNAEEEKTFCYAAASWNAHAGEADKVLNPRSSFRSFVKTSSREGVAISRP